MEHDRRVCLRCGQPAGEHRFCQSCRSHIDALMAIPPRAATNAANPADAVARASREVLRLEQALSAASSGNSDTIAGEPPAAAVEVEPDPRPAETTTAHASSGTVEIDTLSTSAVDIPKGPQEVARFEEVLTVSPIQPGDRAAPDAATSDVEPARVEPEEPTVEVDIAPVAEIERPPTTDEGDTDVARAQQAVARLEELLSATSRSREDQIATDPARATPSDAEPGQEQTHEATAEVNAAPVEEVEDLSSHWIAEASSRHVVAALCLLALIAVAIVLTGRDPRGSFAGRAS